jgi:hypothetical protein
MLGGFGKRLGDPSICGGDLLQNPRRCRAILCLPLRGQEHGQPDREKGGKPKEYRSRPRPSIRGNTQRQPTYPLARGVQAAEVTNGKENADQIA